MRIAAILVAVVLSVGWFLLVPKFIAYILGVPLWRR